MSRSSLLLLCVAVLMVPCRARAAGPEDAGMGTRQFAIECRLIDASSGKQQVLVCPNVTVFEHQRVSLTDLVLRPFVIAASPAGVVAQKPHIEVLPEGVTIDLACHANGTTSVTLDVTTEQPKIVEVEVVKVDDQTSVQQPRVEIAKTRHFVVTNCGESLTIALDGRKLGKSKRWAEFIVREIHDETN